MQENKNPKRLPFFKTVLTLVTNLPTQWREYYRQGKVVLSVFNMELAYLILRRPGASWLRTFPFLRTLSEKITEMLLSFISDSIGRGSEWTQGIPITSIEWWAFESALDRIMINPNCVEYIRKKKITALLEETEKRLPQILSIIKSKGNSLNETEFYIVWGKFKVTLVGIVSNNKLPRVIKFYRMKKLLYKFKKKAKLLIIRNQDVTL